MPPSCALLGGFAIGERVALLWLHNASIPRYDDIYSANALRGLRALLAADWRVTGAFSKLRAVYGKCAWLADQLLAVDGAFSTLLRRPGLQTSTGGVLET